MPQPDLTPLSADRRPLAGPRAPERTENDPIARFFDVASALMTGQAAIIAGGPLADWYAAGVAASGRTQAEIDACLADPATLNGIRAEMSGAQTAGVQGTPSFFVNGRAVADSSLEGLSAAIRPLLPRS